MSSVPWPGRHPNAPPPVMSRWTPWVLADGARRAKLHGGPQRVAGGQPEKSAGDSLLQRRAGAHAGCASSSGRKVLRVRARMRTPLTSAGFTVVLPPLMAAHTVTPSAWRAARKWAGERGR